MRRGRWIGPGQSDLEIDSIAGVNDFTVTLNLEGDRLEAWCRVSLIRILVCASGPAGNGHEDV